MSLLKSGGGRRAARLLVVLLMAMGALWATSAAATVVLYADLAGLVELSDVIVQGRVVDQHTFLDEKTGDIATITTVEVDKTYLGEPSKTVKFRQWGGELGGKLAGIPGDAVFEPYEETFLFLVDGKGEYAGMRYLSALGQAKYSVIRIGANRLVVRDLSDLAFLDREADEVEPRRAERYALDSFIPELESLIAGIKGGKQ